ncbi:MAG: helicase-exonuclease AddAB subunit AddA [Clostridiales bacterium]|uniref:helicase-exonuclease AddAB subunit AddA n=1 Tax=Provencibacterium massiliense TaxID=1841868 RepID=UPI0009A5EB4B|nr:helicase-exonuclease AddAB subunit AddA [Provencibacterium massiliense]PWM41176.1 MAG: helicase-exonuclease AddAB subunit AddA [Clostridiales bacterium]
MANVRWTEQQLQAITARGGSVLVSAAAGSGKTAVLSERVIRLIANRENPTPADRLLIVTFSNAAAAEMKERIAKKLEELVEQNPADSYLTSQQLALQNATIGTIHAFCLQLIRTNFQQLSLSASLRIADERELQLLRREVLSGLVGEYYEENDPLFLQTVELLSAARSDEQLFKTVLRLYDFTRSHPFCEQWLQSKLALYREELPIERTVWGEEILRYAEGAVRFLCQELGGAIDLIKEDDKLSCAYLEAYQSDLSYAGPLLTALQNRDWDGAYLALRAFTFIKLRPLRGYEDEERKARIKAVRDAEKDLIERLRKRLLCVDSVQAREDIRDLRPKIALLFGMVEQFSHRFEERKRERQMVDFSDLEQYAIRLLCRQDEAGGVTPTELARELQGEYDYILLDEYQDTNEAQEMIFSAIQKGDNLFMVGDVKQSIYGFRQADPKIFMRKKDGYGYYDGEHYPAKIILGANFRSRSEICEGINDLFFALMSRRVGQIDYDEDERLVPLGGFPQSPRAGISLELLDMSESEEQAAESEARYVAARIAGMLRDREQVSDHGAMRPVRPGDIGILLRSPRGKAELYLRELAALGIPAFCGAQSTYLQTLEVGTVLSILRATNNPLNDIPLVAAMMSPVYAFSAGEVAKIRLYQKGKPYYLALLEGQRQGDERCKGFLNDLRDFRRMAAGHSTARLLRYIYQRTALPELVGALDNPEGRLANLNLLIGYARTYENAGYRTLSQFLRFLEEVESAGDDLSPANLSAGRGDAVQIMSIHRSKGLEFPVVFLCDCAKRFNKEDLRQNVLLHSELGFACVRRDYETMSQYTTVPLEAVRLAVERELASEEMRVLYVALTRAKERLILTGALDRLQRKLGGLYVSPKEDGRLPEHAVAAGQSYLEWILMVVLSHPDGAPLREYASLPAGRLLPAKGRFSCRITSTPEAAAQEEAAYREPVLTAEPDRRLVEQIRKNVARSYRYQGATLVPTKVAVTAITEGVEKGEAGKSYLFSKQPRFITHERLTAAMKGDAFHKYMLFADHAAASVDPEAEIKRLVDEGFLSCDEGAALERRQVAAFYRSSLYGRMERAQRVEREFRFMTQLGAEKLAPLIPQIGEERVTVQGICDLVLFEEDGALIVDYKTDRVREPQALLERYRGQILLYAEILEKILRQSVKGCILYSTVLSQEIEVPMAGSQKNEA